MEDNSHRKPPQRAGTRRGGGGGEIVEVEGGHIVRSSDGKDRHSKVCTAKGTRDRRVRLSAHTAIQFYDVQDRLGYDRPSKAVDWLIDKARAAIDELQKLPPWHPNTSPATSSKPEHRIIGASGEDWRVLGGGGRGCSVLSQNPNISSSFFRAVSPPQLETFQDPIFLEHREQVLFSGISHLGFDEWSEHVPSWNNNTGGATASGGSGGGSLEFSCSPPAAPLLGCQNQFFSQRGPLQSSNTPSIRPWMDPEPPIADSDHHQFPFPYSVSGIGFNIPARNQGEEENNGIYNKPSSASSGSCH